jgi:DNA-binding transcriptional ArsR family regulator/uncharacterized protein YndB with AHSA1/START domain
MDAIFKALNDPTRRALLDSLRQRDGQTLTDLEERLAMTRFGVMKHLKVLEEAGLVLSVKRGRFRYHYLNALPLQEVIDRWIDPLLAKPAARALIALKAELEGTAPMLDTEKKPDFVMETLIRCTQDALWDALTKADQMAAYHYHCRAARGDAAPGGTTEFLRADGSTMLTQRTLAIEPKSRIEMSFEPNWGDSSASSRVVFRLAAEGALCKLTCEHYDLPPEQMGVREGWMRWGSSLKSWLETGTPIRAEDAA